ANMSPIQRGRKTAAPTIEADFDRAGKGGTWLTSRYGSLAPRGLRTPVALLLLPSPCSSDDAIDIRVEGHKIQLVFRARRIRYKAGGIASASRGNSDGKFPACHAFD